MTIAQYKVGTVQSFMGLSTDTKPAGVAGPGGPQTGDTFFETDTGNLYIFNNASGVQAWTLYQNAVGEDFLAQTLTAQGTGTVNSGDLIPTSGAASAGFNVGINITVLTAGTLTVTVQGKDSSSGTYYTLLASAAIAATGFTRLQIGPLIAAVANSIAQTYVPKIIRISSVVATGPCTATIGISPF